MSIKVFPFVLVAAAMGVLAALVAARSGAAVIAQAGETPEYRTACEAYWAAQGEPEVICGRDWNQWYVTTPVQHPVQQVTAAPTAVLPVGITTMVVDLRDECRDDAPIKRTVRARTTFTLVGVRLNGQWLMVIDQDGQIACLKEWMWLANGARFTNFTILSGFVTDLDE
jgi:hypothetical protein